MNKTNVLLAEDDVDDYNLFAEAFEKISPSFSIRRVKNGLECISYLKTREKPDAIFLDLNIPIKNGVECLNFIKDSEALQDIPVIIFSTAHYIKHIDAAYKSGAHYYIVKPSEANALADMLSIVITRLDKNLDMPCKENFVVRNTATLEH